MSAARITSLMLVLTTACNLKCVYCYEGGSGAGEVMDEATAIKAIELAASGGSRFHLQLTGGEPLLVPGLVLRILDFIRRENIPASTAIQTNGVLLDREMVGALKASGTAVGISVDGLPAIQEQLRGEGPATWRAMKLLDSEGVPFSITTVLTAANVPHLSRLAMALHSLPAASAIGLDPLVRKGFAIHAPGVLLPEADLLRDGVNRLLETLDLLNARRSRPLVLRERQTVLKALDRTGLYPYCQACTGSSIAVMPRGALYPCTQTMSDSAFQLGTLDRPVRFESSLSSGCAREFDSCDECELQMRCPGDCPSRLHYNGGRMSVQVCTLYRTIYAYSRKKGEIK